MSAPTARRRNSPHELRPEQQARLRQELEQELRRLVPEARRVLDPKARAELAHSLGPRPRSHALQILEALHRMETGTYGRCAGCHGAISYVRLSAIPEARDCAECSWSRELSFGR